VTTLPVDITHGDKSESSPSKFKLERSKTERQRHLRPEDAAQIFNDKLPVQEKVHNAHL
jgi:sterol 3beta-glucosyltransferase